MSDGILDPQSSTAEDVQGEDVLKHLHSILNHKWLIVTVTAIAFCVSTFQNYKKPDYYSATARVLVHKVEDSKMTPYTEATQQQVFDTSYFETQVEIMKSAAVAKQVAQNLDLKKHYGTGTNDEAAGALRNKITAWLIRNTRILTVTVTDGDPEWAAKIVNEVTSVYVQEALRDRMFVSEQILKWFPDDAAQVVQQSKSPEDLMKRIEKDNMAEKLPTIANDPNIRKMRQEKNDLEGKIRELLTRYTPEHPQIKEINGRLEYIETEIKLQTSRLISSLKDALAGEFSVSNIKVLEKAATPSRPSGPNRRKNIITVTLMALAASVALAIFLDSIDKTIKSDEDILGIPGLPFLGNVPVIETKAKKSNMPLTLEELASDVTIADSMTSLNTALLFSMPKGQNKLIMVTSTIPAEGKTTVGYMLALSMAKLRNKVLYVELDLRRPSLSQKIKMPAGTKGISDYLVGNASFEEVVINSAQTPDLGVIFAGRSSPNPTALFTSKAFDDFIRMVEQKYDRIIFDTPPSLHIPDSIILSSRMHGIVFIIGTGMVHRKVALKTLAKFRFVNSTIFGAIINRVNLKKSRYGGYRSYYGKYYAKRPDAA